VEHRTANVERRTAVIIRDERPEDVPFVRDVNRLAFEQDQEANIVDALRSNGVALLSLVAVIDDAVVGHILYSPAFIGGVEGAGLAPMAVLPEHQRRGIGSQLVEAGNARLRDRGCPFIIVLGHPGFYPRFGFRPARAMGVTCEWDVPDDVFMIVVLDEHRMRGVSGLARYREEFSTIS
jgi:putative acetyltransferase